MNKIMKRLTEIIAVLGIGGLFALQAQAEENRVTFPEDLDKYVRYGIYDRGSSGEEAFALPETLEGFKAGKPFPNGTRLFLRILRNGQLTSYFVMEKGEGWGNDYDGERRTGDWQFQQFDTDMKPMASANTAQCQSCHSNMESNEYMYTTDDMRAFVP